MADKVDEIKYIELRMLIQQLERSIDQLYMQQKPVIFAAPCLICDTKTSHVSHIATHVPVAGTTMASTACVQRKDYNALRTCLDCGHITYRK